MSGVYVSMQEQESTDATLSLKAMGTQLGINIGISLGVMAGFSLLRPRHTLVYAPKFKFSTPERRPPPIGNGYFAWVKPVLSADDDFLMERIGFDAVLFLRFVRLIRRLLILMSIIGVFCLIPVNIVATYFTGDWPPPAGLSALSISGINAYYNSDPTDADAAAANTAKTDMRWYWSPAGATWLFTLLIGWFLYRASCDYIEMRQRFFHSPPNKLSARALLVSHIPESVRSDEKLKKWMNGLGIQYPIMEAVMGYHSAKLTDLMQEHEEAVRHLETSLSSYLTDGKGVDSKKRPTMRTGGFMCLGGEKVDCIDYYTEEVKDLEAQIKKLRQSSDAKVANYGWVAFEKIQYAHVVDQSLMHKKSIQVRLSPPPSDLIWSNLGMSEKTRKSKRWIGRALFWILIFVWMIPVGALSATSNIVNLIRLLPNSEQFIDSHAFLMGMVQAYFTPIVMALFFLLLPYLLRFLSKQQGYQTETTLDRKVLSKLYIFFIINNLLVFTLTSMLIGIYGQIRSLILSGQLSSDFNISDYIVQLAKNITGVSTFWINYVCIKALGLTMEMGQVLPLVMISLRKWITRPSPRELREFAQPPVFNYPLAYNTMLFFFTIALLYGIVAPLILPFALLFFVISTMVYKYMLMYIYVTKQESGGRMWPVLFQCILTSTVLFQILMIIILSLKGGHLQSYILIPLPVLTVVYMYFYHVRMKSLGSFLSQTAGSYVHIKEEDPNEQHDDKQHKSATEKESLGKTFQDPGLTKKLITPMVHDDVKHLLPQVYHHAVHPVQEAFEMIQHKMDLDEHRGFQQQHRRSKRLTLIQPDNEDDETAPLAFYAVSDAEDAMSLDDDDDDSSSDYDGMMPQQQDSVQNLWLQNGPMPPSIAIATPLTSPSSFNRLPDTWSVLAQPTSGATPRGSTLLPSRTNGRRNSLPARLSFISCSNKEPVWLWHRSMPDLQYYVDDGEATSQLGEEELSSMRWNRTRRGSEPVRASTATDISLLLPAATTTTQPLRRNHTLPSWRMDQAYDYNNSSARSSFNSSTLSELVLRRSQMGRASIAPSSTHSRYRITYYDDILNSPDFEQDDQQQEHGS